MGPLIQSRKCMSLSLKFAGELRVMTIKNDAKFEEELTCQFKIDMRNLTNFELSTWKSQNLHFNWLLLTKVYNLWAKESTEELRWMTLNIDAKFEGKLTFLSPSLCPRRKYTWTLNWKQSILIYIENCQDVPYSHEEEQNDEHFYNS